METVKVPETGGFTKDKVPLTVYKSFEHAVGVADNEEIEQLHDAGAV